MTAVTRLTLTRFRNYRSARLDVAVQFVAPRSVVVCGPNGAGKTNLLEALSFFSPGRGMRRARLDEVGEVGEAGGPDLGWAVAATLSTSAGVMEIGTGREPGGGERRLVRIDGQLARSQTALSDHLSILWLTPQMDQLFVDGGLGRRRFLDRMVFGFDSAHAGRLSRYEHALRERGRLLREGRADPSWLAALEEQMAAIGVAIVAARRELVARLNVACAAGIGPFPQAGLAVVGAVEDGLDLRPALALEDDLRERLRGMRRADALSGGATIGPHRSDFQVRYYKGVTFKGDTGVPAESCSTGEQKALLLAIVLANARLLADAATGPPLLLLDEVVAHLDSSRREALFNEITALGGQAWLTGTDAILFAPLRGRAQFVNVENGGVTMIEDSVGIRL
ncbi:MAG: DNA replication/repair protein RecF [Rhodospirillaceae bacterium]